MSSLNKALFDAAYKWHLDQGNRIFITLLGKSLSDHPILRSYVKPVPGLQGFETLILNISPRSCQLLSLDAGLSFEGRFSGRAAAELFPWETVIAIYNPDNSKQGINLPQTLIATEAEESENVVPMKKSNPFSVIDGGKE